MRFSDKLTEEFERAFARVDRRPFGEGKQHSVAQELEQIGTGNIYPRGFIAERAIDDVGTFGDGLRPVQVVADTLPTLPDDDYPDDEAVVLRQTDGKLYRNVGGSWTASIEVEDLDGEITETQIADGAISTPKLAANAVIANVINAGGTVLINSDGIYIASGALTMEDYSGQSVLSAAGFQGSWRSFIESGGIFNADFKGSTSGNLAQTIVSSAATNADYLASLSTEMPYWVIEDADANAALSIEAEATAPSGLALKFTSSGGGVTREAKLFQDIPVRAGAYLGLTLIGAPGYLGFGDPVFETLVAAISVPLDAKYLRLILTMTEEPDSDTYLTVSARFHGETHNYLSSHGETTVISNALYSTYGAVWIASVAINSQTFAPTVEGGNGNYIDVGADGDLIYLGTTGTVELPGGVLLLDDVTIQRPGAGVVEVGGDLNVTGSLEVNDGETIGWGDIGFERISGTVVEMRSSSEELHSAGEQWTAVSFTNSWVNFGSPQSTAAYRLDSRGFVELKGLIKSGTVGSAAFTLPVGFRPSEAYIFPCFSNGGIGRIDIGTNGAVTPSSPSNNASVSLNGISFKV